MLLVRTIEELPTVKVSLSRYDEGSVRRSPAVEFEVGRGRKVLTRFTVDQSEVGIPPGFDPGQYRGEEPRFELSPHVLERMAGAGLDRDDEDALWLQMASPIGYLTALPWESMLRPAFRSWPVILRIPDFTLAPQRGAGPISIVLCASQPGGEPLDPQRLLAEIFRLRLDESWGVPATIHVFTDPRAYSFLRSRFDSEPEWSSAVVLHDPRETDREDVNSWLAWLQREMSGTAVDLVHFLAHGYVADGQPALVMAESPTAPDDRLWGRLISPGQLAACLTQLGAWAFGLSALPRNSSPLGLRMFADSVARLRPGPILYEPGPARSHDYGAYEGLLFGGRPYVGDGAFLYVHPRLTNVRGKPSYAESLVEQTLGPTRGFRPLPTWATTTRRYLEQSAAQLFPRQAEPGSAEESAIGQGVSNALRFVDEVIRERREPQA
jgi:hypothetical protein